MEEQSGAAQSTFSSDLWRCFMTATFLPTGATPDSLYNPTGGFDFYIEQTGEASGTDELPDWIGI
jgi:hypothetical protein